MELSIIGKDRTLEIQLKGELDHHGAKGLLTQMDALITDYSSCIFDFALTKKPGFLFAPDLEDYRKVRLRNNNLLETCF